MHRVGLGQGIHHNRMPSFMISHNTLLFFADQAAFSFRAGNDALNGLFQVFLLDRLFIASSRQDSALINQVLQVCAYKARRRTSQHAHIGVGC